MKKKYISTKPIIVIHHCCFQKRANSRSKCNLITYSRSPENSRSRKEHSYVLVLSKARRNWWGPTPYHYISIEVERARFHVPRRFSSKSWKIQSASRSKRYANEHELGHERDRERGYDYFHCFSIPSGKHRVRSGCFYLRSSSANLFSRLLLSSFPPNA